VVDDGFLNCKHQLLIKNMTKLKKKSILIYVPAVAVIRDRLALSIITGCKTFGDCNMDV